MTEKEYFKKEKDFTDKCFNEGLSPEKFLYAFTAEFGYVNEKLFTNYFKAYHKINGEKFK